MALTEFGILHAELNGSSLNGAQGQAADHGSQIRSPSSDGSVQETLHYIPRYTPRADMSSLAIKTIMDLLNGSVYAPIKALNGTTGLALYGAKVASDAPAYASGTVHEKLVATHGVLAATGLSWQQDAEAVLSLAAILRSNDGGDSGPWTGSQATLPTIPTNEEAWTVTGLVIPTLAASGIDGLQSVELSMNPGIEPRWNGSKPYPSLIRGGGANGPVQHRLSFSSSDQTLQRTLAGGVAYAGAVVLTLTKYSQGAGLSATTFAFTLNDCLIVNADALSGQQGSPQATNFQVIPRFDGTNNALSWA